MSPSTNYCSLFYDDSDENQTVYIFEFKGKTVVKKDWSIVRNHWQGIVDGTHTRKYKEGTVEDTRTTLAALDLQEQEGRIEAMSTCPALCQDVPLSRKQKDSRRQVALESARNAGKKETKKEKAKRLEIGRLNATINRKSTLPKTRAKKIARLLELGEVPW